jgi:hypothetical protein
MPNHIIPMYPVLKVICSDNDFRDSFLKQIWYIGLVQNKFNFNF